MKEEMTALIVLTPEMGRGLIAMAVAKMDRVQKRTKEGRMVIVGGGTTRYVAQQLTGEDPGRDAFAVGCIKDASLGETDKKGRGAGPFLFDNGIVSRGWPGELLESFQAGDIYIKGANAIDVDGNVGILMGSPTGGTIGAAMTLLLARGGELIIPVSLEKLIPSVAAAIPLLGQGKVDRVMGGPVGMMPIMASAATVVTEVTAIKLLADVQATPVAAGGMDDCQGSITIHLQGSRSGVEFIWDLVNN
ncbi:MAG: hypothetical protein HQL69_22905 [Magnetococcales bacterium]|nr:hypothetical protein [Magnetococcales bacterium]